MDIEINIVLGIPGLVLTIIEVWIPKSSVALEKYIDSHILEIEQFHNLYLKEFRALAKVADSTVKEALKGPHFVTPEEFKANTVASIINIKSYLQFYVVTAFNFIILKPLSFLLAFLNIIGKGRAVGGIGIVLAVSSTFL